MKKVLEFLGKTIACIAGLYLGMFLVYYFNLENKLIFYVVRPLLNKLYKKKRDVRI